MPRDSEAISEGFRLCVYRTEGSIGTEDSRCDRPVQSEFLEHSGVKLKTPDETFQKKICEMADPYDSCENVMSEAEGSVTAP